MIIENNLDFIQLFEEALCRYTGFNYAICVDCCTNALLLSLICLQMFNEIQKDKVILLPKQTYLSVPMMLKNNGWRFQFATNNWLESYELGDTKIFDAAVHFNENMSLKYNDAKMVCVSFQQKKRLSLERGGVIFTNNSKYIDLLKRLRHDGRNPYLTVKEEITLKSDNIVCGYHCYMEPVKAALGINLLNQHNLLKHYEMHSYKDYPDISKLKCFKKND